MINVFHSDARGSSNYAPLIRIKSVALYSITAPRMDWFAWNFGNESSCRCSRKYIKCAVFYFNLVCVSFLWGTFLAFPFQQGVAINTQLEQPFSLWLAYCIYHKSTKNNTNTTNTHFQKVLTYKEVSAIVPTLAVSVKQFWCDQCMCTRISSCCVDTDRTCFNVKTEADADCMIPDYPDDDKWPTVGMLLHSFTCLCYCKFTFAKLLLYIGMIWIFFILVYVCIFVHVFSFPVFVPSLLDRLNFYARKQLCFQRVLAIAILSVRPSVCLSITWVDQAKMVKARISKSSPSAARKTLVSGTVKLFHKFEKGHPERGH